MTTVLSAKEKYLKDCEKEADWLNHTYIFEVKSNMAFFSQIIYRI